MYRYRDPLTHATVTMHMTAQAVQDHIFAQQKRHSAFRTWAIPHKATSLRSVLFCIEPLAHKTIHNYPNNGWYTNPIKDIPVLLRIEGYIELV